MLNTNGGSFANNENSSEPKTDLRDAPVEELNHRKIDCLVVKEKEQSGRKSAI